MTVEVLVATWIAVGGLLLLASVVARRHYLRTHDSRDTSEDIRTAVVLARIENAAERFEAVAGRIESAEIRRQAREGRA